MGRNGDTWKQLGSLGTFWGEFGSFGAHLGSFGVSLGPLEIRSHSTLNPMSFWAKFHHFCVNPKADMRDSLYRVRLGLGIGILGPFWGKLGSFGVSLGPLEMRSHSTTNPMSFWAEIRHLCDNPKRIRGNPLYGVRLGLGIGILGQIGVFWGKFGSFGDAQPLHLEPNVILGQNLPFLCSFRSQFEESAL